MTALRANLNRWQTHLESTRFDQREQGQRHSKIDSFVHKENQFIDLQSMSTETTFLGGHSKALRPFTMQNVRKLPIVGDVYCGRK